MVSHWGGTNSDDLEGACPAERMLLFNIFVINALAQSLSGNGGGVVYPYLAIGRHIFEAAETHVREGKVSPVYTSDCEGVLFTHELVGALLSFSGKVAIGEMVAVKTLMGSAAGAVEDGEGEAREASDMYYIGSEVCRR